MIDWTFDSREVEWMLDHLTNIWDGRLVSLAPAGFPAYGRLLHPAYGPDNARVRWADIADHHGVPMLPTSAFVHVALPERLRDGTTAWIGRPPRGGLERRPAGRLVELLAPYTQTADRVSFALRADFGRHTRVGPNHPPEPAPDPIPPLARSGFRMRVPGREYIAYRGHLDDALAWGHQKDDPNWWWIDAEAPQLWWPPDHAWAVASDAALPWTIIAGSQDLIAQLVRDPEIEVMAITEDDAVEPRPAWLTAVIERAVHDLMNHRRAVIDTTRGTVFCHMTANEETGLRLESGGGWALLHLERANRSLEDQIFDRVWGALQTQLHLL